MVVLVLHISSQRALALAPLTEHAIILRGSPRGGFDGADIQLSDDNVTEIGHCGNGKPVRKEAGTFTVVTCAWGLESHYTSAVYEWIAGSGLSFSFRRTGMNGILGMVEKLSSDKVM